MALKHTPLYETHLRLGGRLIEFGGWEMPVQYTGIIEEHQAVRHAAGIFDISHMGQAQVTGPQAVEFLNATFTNDVHKLRIGQGQYTLLCREDGGVIDDLLVYRVADQNYWVVFNASRFEVDMGWLEQQRSQHFAEAELQVERLSPNFGMLAVQGPAAASFIDAALEGPLGGGTALAQACDLKKNQIGSYSCAGGEVWVARTGYTGEDGFELLVPASALEKVWERISTVGRTHGLRPAGLGARDTLRTEAGYPLYGHELSESITPLEAGLDRFVALDKPCFCGREPLLRQKSVGVLKKNVAFKLTEKAAPPRPHYAIWSASAESAKIGEVVSGTQSPSMGVGIGMGYVPPAFSPPGTALRIEIRGKQAAAVVVAKPIYRKETRTTPVSAIVL